MYKVEVIISEKTEAVRLAEEITKRYFDPNDRLEAKEVKVTKMQENVIDEEKEKKAREIDERLYLVSNEMLKNVTDNVSGSAKIKAVKMEEQELTYGERMAGDEFFKETCKWKKETTRSDYTHLVSSCGVAGINPPHSWNFCPYCGKEMEVER